MIVVGSRLTIVTENEVITCVVKRIRLRGETDSTSMVVIEPPTDVVHVAQRPEPTVAVGTSATPLGFSGLATEIEPPPPPSPYKRPDDIPLQDGRQVRYTGPESPLCGLNDWDGYCVGCAHEGKPTCTMEDITPQKARSDNPKPMPEPDQVKASILAEAYSSSPCARVLRDGAESRMSMQLDIGDFASWKR